MNIGETFSHYTVLEKLGAGGMGDIYKAQDTRLNRFVALKVLSGSYAGDPERQRRFIQEAQAASALNHPNIITIYDVISQDGFDLMVMEFVIGTTLDAQIPEGGMGAHQSVAIGVQIADALQAAHSAGIIHRDLKPGNIMITSSGLVKILDFGLAKLTLPPATAGPTDETLPISAPMTMEGSILGTVSYMSPEQAEGRKLDGRSDIFSFGLVLYEMLTGRKAFSSGSTVSTLSAILRDDPKPIAQIVTGVPRELEQVVSRAIRKEPADRWQSMGDLKAALAGLKQKYETAAVMAVQAGKPRFSKTVMIGAAAALAAVLLTGGGLWLRHKRTAAVVSQAAAQPASPVTPETPPAVPAPVVETPPAPVDNGLTNDAIVDMLQAKVPNAVIISHIRSSKTKFDLSTSEIIRLTKSGATSSIIDVMRNPSAPVSTASAAPPTSPARSASAPAPAKSATSTPGANQNQSPLQSANPAPNTPTNPVPNSNPAPPQPAPVVAAPAAPEPKGPTAIIYGGIPLSVKLADTVPNSPAAGMVLHFVVDKEFRLKDSVVVAAGTPLTGEIADPGGEKKLLKRTKPTFRVSEVQATDGTKLKLRPTPGRRNDNERIDAPIEPPGHRDKDNLAPAGSSYILYFDGDQIVTLKK